MEKAYDLKALGQLIKEEAEQKGFTVAEDALEEIGRAVYSSFSKWIQQSAALSETKIDDLVAPFLSHFDSMVKAQIEKLDLDGDGD